MELGTTQVDVVLISDHTFSYNYESPSGKRNLNGFSFFHLTFSIFNVLPDEPNPFQFDLKRLQFVRFENNSNISYLLFLLELGSGVIDL